MALRVVLFAVVLAVFFLGIWSTSYSIQGFLLFGFLSAAALLNVLKLGTSNKEVAKKLKDFI